MQKTTYLKDYQPPAYTTRKTNLTFELHDGHTDVTSLLELERLHDDGTTDLVLDGQELELLSVAVDGAVLTSNEYRVDEDSLTLFDLPRRCELTIATRIQPEKNTALEGLYKSGSMYCTQCEAQGFRKITYYQDRPDVLSVFTTTIVADPSFPVLLSNGNPVASESLDDGRRKVIWEDPFPKPSYLFALVAGDLAVKEDEFVTVSGRTVTLKIFSEPHNIDQCDYAMDVLKRSMRWDEEVFGREYDLDIFMIVAVEDFNMGAMENKGLNIFNTSCVLATPDTAMDQAYQRVEGVVAHEYFHNWSGNRVTCRDWFQLSLKEGFTVYRDAEFSSDMNSRTVKRIEDVNFLRSVQFAEDAGPLAHPIRPDSYIEISNFYTPTVYDKGAEVVGMLRTILGPSDFRSGSDLYFDRHDGQAATTDDFLSAMAEASGQRLDRFQRWYEQAGTPVLDVQGLWTEGAYRLRISQSCPATPGQDRKRPFHIPIRLGLISTQGVQLVGSDLTWESASPTEIRGDSLVLQLTEASTDIVFGGLEKEPEVSFLRGFSAPVRVNFPRSNDSLAFLAVHDTDGFASWDALQSLVVSEIDRIGDPDGDGEISGAVLHLFGELLDRALDVGEDSELRFLLAAKLSIAEEGYLFEQYPEVDVERICAARDRLIETLARAHESRLRQLFQRFDGSAPYSPDALSASGRALKHTALRFLTEVMPSAELETLLGRIFERADNLTDRRAALAAFVNSWTNPSDVGARLLDSFYQTWQEKSLAVNVWFSLQSTARHCDADHLRELARHSAFDVSNPNKIRAVYTAFAYTNARNFHAPDGSGYLLISEVISMLNDTNPQMAAALAKPLTRWRRFTPDRARLMRNTLQKISAQEALSPDVYEVVSKALAGQE